MEYPLLAPVERCVLKCLAVDRANTAVRDDGFRITQRGKMLQVDMVAVVPPAHQVMVQEIWQLMGAQMHTRDNLWIFRPLVRETVSLSDTPRDVLVVTHLLLKNELVREEVSLSRAVVETTSYEEYAKSKRFFMDRIAVMRAVNAQPRLRKHVEACREELEKEAGEGNVLVYAMLELFNKSCREMANDLNSPFVTFLGAELAHQVRKGYKIFEGFARFNRGLRDPCAFLNILNLVYALQKKSVYVTEEDLRRHLPRVL
jgi:hypothetical protein